MKKTIHMADTIHDFKKTNIVTNNDGSDDYKCKKCGLTGKRRGFSSLLEVNGKAGSIENCAGDTAKTREPQVDFPNNEIDFQENPVTIDEDTQDPELVSSPSRHPDEDILEHAADIFNEEQVKIALTDRDKVMQDIGSIKTLQFNEFLSRYMKAQKLNKLLTGKAYKELGLNNAYEVFELVGIKPSLGKQIVRNIRALTDDGYKALTSINLRQKDINLLAKSQAKVETKGDEVFVTVAGKKIDAHDPEEMQAALAKIEAENKGFQNKIKSLENAYVKSSQENAELKAKLDEYTEPDKALVNAIKTTQDIQNEFSRLIDKLRRLLVKNNPGITDKVLETLSLMDKGFSSLRDFINDEEQALVCVPEDLIEKYGGDEN